MEKISTTYSESGTALTETCDDITMPADYSFASVNDYVHGIDVHYEDLECLCLGMASYIDELKEAASVERDASDNRLGFVAMSKINTGFRKNGYWEASNEDGKVWVSRKTLTECIDVLMKAANE